MAVNQRPKSRFFHIIQFKAVCLTQSFGPTCRADIYEGLGVNVSSSFG